MRSPPRKGFSEASPKGKDSGTSQACLRKVTWPELPDVRRATVAIIVFVLLLGLFIWLLDVVLQQVLVKVIPSLFTGR